VFHLIQEIFLVSSHPSQKNLFKRESIVLEIILEGALKKEIAYTDIKVKTDFRRIRRPPKEKSGSATLRNYLNNVTLLNTNLNNINFTKLPVELKFYII
jgi:hypothetical protein